MESRSTNRMMIALIFLLFGVAIFGLIRWIGFTQDLGDNPWQNYKADLLAKAHADVLDARKVWNGHKAAHYRLVIDRLAGGPNAVGAPQCRQDLEIRDETVATTYQDTCALSTISFFPAAVDWKAPTPPFETTISQLFDTAERDTSELFWTAQGAGCDFFMLEVHYDSQSGYPAQLAYRVQSPPAQMGSPIRADFFNPGEPTPGPSCQAQNIPDGPTITARLTPMQ